MNFNNIYDERNEPKWSKEKKQQDYLIVTLTSTSSLKYFYGPSFLYKLGYL